MISLREIHNHIKKTSLFLFVVLFFTVSNAYSQIRQISIKTAQYSESLEFVCDQGGNWTLGGKTGVIPPQTKCSLVGKLLSKAIKKYHVIIGEAPLSNPDALEQTIAPWKAGGWKIHKLTIGKILKSDDNNNIVNDNRTILAAIGVYDDLEAAKQLVNKLLEADYSPWIFTEVVKPSSGTVSLFINGQKQAEGTELILAPKNLVRLFKVEYAVGFPWHGFADRDYRGIMIFRFGIHDAIDCVLKSDLESILAGIVPSEISYKAEKAALQAQATAARGEILAKIGKAHPYEGFDTCSEQHCQVYAGETALTPDIAQKITPTIGQVLYKPDGTLLEAVYSSNCGGHSEANQIVWNSPANPILQGIWDAPSTINLDLSEEEQVGVFIRSSPPCYCNDPTVEGGDKFRWKKTITATDWKKIESQLGIGRIKSVTNLARGFSGRIYQMTFNGENGSKIIRKELTIRQLLGSLRSSCFIADWKKDASGFIIGAELLGAGFGHGVGMCQTGAQSLAKKGWSFDKILAHYYPGSILRKLY